jgi:hypothetical protein
MLDSPNIPVNLKDLFSNISTRMRADFESARTALSHAGLKGTAFEGIVKGFFRLYLPDRLGIATGQLVDSTGAVSKQLDVIIFDKWKTPILYDNNGVQVIPVECVYAVVEVKARLDAQQLPSIHANMLSVKGLKKTAYYEGDSVIIETNSLYGQKWKHWPTNYFVFGFESPDPRTMQVPMIEYHNASLQQPHLRIDLMCILDRGVYLNLTQDGKFDALPTFTSVPVYIATDQSLLLFYALVVHLMNQARMPNFRFSDYIGKIDWKRDESTVG